MFDITKLPKEPIAAFRQILTEIYSALPETNTRLRGWSNKDVDYYSLAIQLKAASQIATRIGDPEIKEISRHNLKIDHSENTHDVGARVSKVLSALTVFDMDRHFMNEDDVSDFDEAIIPFDEREEIRDALQKARNLAATAQFMTDPVRRSFMHKISKAENELFKEKVGVQAFFAIAYEGSRLLRRYGEDAQPLADAIEKARTSTEKHTTGYNQIGMDEPPKQIEDKSGEPDPSA